MANLLRYVNKRDFIKVQKDDFSSAITGGAHFSDQVINKSNHPTAVASNLENHWDKTIFYLVTGTKHKKEVKMDMFNKLKSTLSNSVSNTITNTVYNTGTMISGVLPG